LVEKTYSLQQCQGILGQMFLRGKKNVANISLFLSAKSHMGYLRQLYRLALENVTFFCGEMLPRLVKDGPHTAMPFGHIL
jgi:hypothetical protein